MRFLLVVIALLGFALSGAAQAQDRVALVVANSALGDGSQRTTSRNSAELVASSLRNAGFAVTTINDATSDSLRSAFRDFLIELDATGTGLGFVYFAGFATQVEGSNYLLPSDIDPRSRPDYSLQAMSLKGILDSLSLTAANKVVLIDATWTNGAAGASLRGGSAGPAAMQPPPSTILAFSSEPGTVALDGNGTTSAFADGLAAAMAHPGLNVGDMLGEARTRVASATGGQQIPWSVGNLSQPVVLIEGTQAAAMPAEPGAAAPEPPAPQPPPPAPEPQAPGSIFDMFNGGSLFGGALQADQSPEVGSAPPPPAPAQASPPDDTASAAPDLAGAPPPLDAAPPPLASEMPEPDLPPDIAASPPPLESTMPDPSDMAGAPPPLDAAPTPPAEEPMPDIAEAPVLEPEPQPLEAPPPAASPAPAPAGANPYQAIASMSEAEAWAAISQTSDPMLYYAYMMAFPASPHALEARRRLVELMPPAAAAASPPAQDLTAGAQNNLGEAVTAAAAPPPAEADIKLERHPTVEAPESAIVGEPFTVTVALTEQQITPDVSVRAAPTTEVTPEGAIAFSLPDAEEWTIDMDLLAAGFDLVDGGKWSRSAVLYKVGDSDFVRFELKARPIAEATKARQIMVRFYHSGRFLGSASRPIAVMRDELAAAAAPPADAPGLLAAPKTQPMTTEVVIGSEDEVPDLDVTIHYDDPDNLGKGLIVLHSPHMPGPVSGEFETPAGMTEWLETGYSRLVSLGLKLRGATSLTQAEPQDEESQRRFITKVAEGLGDDLYRNYVPQQFKDVFWSLKLRGLLKSVQITSNSPVLPWELVRPMNAEGAQSDGFLGISYRLARWAPRAVATQVDRPLNRMAFTGVAAVAPAYADHQALPFQKVELDALSKLNGFRQVGGDFSAFEKMVGEVSTGFIHFSGHGELNDPGDGRPVFAIRLTDQALDPNTWRALKFAPHDRGNPFYFFNACDTGQAASLGGFVQGWGPAVLASGASGFIGGMWPLTDRTAAAFSTEFYGGVSGHLTDGPVYLAEVLQDVRGRFYETGDPTYLAYTYYGSANLKITAQ